MMAIRNWISADGAIWLPHIQSVEDGIMDAQDTLLVYYDIWMLHKDNLFRHPLYCATNLVDAVLLLCPDKLTNESKIKPYLDYSDFPFYCLKLKC